MCLDCVTRLWKLLFYRVHDIQRNFCGAPLSPLPPKHATACESPLGIRVRPPTGNGFLFRRIIQGVTQPDLKAVTADISLGIEVTIKLSF
jgi:hypothetical protein